jgi:hypothetical protein
MQTKGLNKSDLPQEVQALIKKIESTIRSVALVNKKDEQGNFIVTPNTKAKIDELDKKLVNSIWDYLDEKQKEQIRSEQKKKEEQIPPATEKKEEPNPITPPATEKKEEEIKKEEPPKKQSSLGSIGFFDW